MAGSIKMIGILIIIMAGSIKTIGILLMTNIVIKDRLNEK